MKSLMKIALVVMFVTVSTSYASTNLFNFATNNGIDTATAERVVNNATEAIFQSSFAASGVTINNIVGGLTSGSRTSSKGLQLKDPMAGVGFTYSYSDDKDSGGFAGHEGRGDIAFDTDIYDGLIAGVAYQYSHRNSENAQGVSEEMDAHAVSLYLAKRFFNYLNTGISYHYATTEQSLSRGVVANLDNDANGVTAVLGLSRKYDKWNWALTSTLTYFGTEYSVQQDTDTGKFTGIGTLGYDLCKHCTISGVFAYHNFFEQDQIGNTPARDSDYFTIGPRLQFYPTDRATISLDFDSQQGYAGLSVYTVRLGADVAF